MSGISACNCMRTVRRARSSARNECPINVPQSNPGPLGLSRFRREMHAICRTVRPTQNPLDRTRHTGTGFGNNSALELCGIMAGHFRCSPENYFSARGFATTSVSRSQTAAIESDQLPQSTLEDAPPAEDALPAEDASSHFRPTAKNSVDSETDDLNTLRSKCRQSRQFKLRFRYSELSQLFGEETCRLLFSMPGQDEVKVMATAPERKEAEREACFLLIAKLKETGIWQKFFQRFYQSSVSQPQTEVAINDDLFFNIDHASKKLDNLSKMTQALLKGGHPVSLPSKPESLSPSYRITRSRILARRLKYVRESQDWRALALQSARAGLPVNTLKPQILNLVNSHTYSLIVAETGSGKSTQVPQIILDDAIDRGVGGDCNVLCVQPRRVAAQLLARRVAEERFDSGETVGHMVRFDYRFPAKCGAISFCTTGVMLNMLQNSDNPLSLYSHIILDEVHVRDVGIDFVMLLLKRRIDQLRLTGAPAPKIVVMSATLDIDLFTSYFGNEGPNGTLVPAPYMSIPGRQYHVQRHYLDEVLDLLKTSPSSQTIPDLLEEEETVKFLKSHYKQFPPRDATEVAGETGLNPDIEDLSKGLSSNPSADPTTGKTYNEDPIVPLGLICATIFHILKTTTSGAILVFLPGMQQLIRVEEMLNDVAPRTKLDFRDGNLFRILKLHSELPAELRALTQEVPDGCRRILLSTDISEASLTLPDVEYVIDAGKVNIMISDQKSLSNRVALCWISQSSSSQRAGRAGRVKNGQYFFLGTQQRFDSLRATNAPEILRADLQDTCLRAKQLDSKSSISEFLNGAIESPDNEKVELAVQSLQGLGALSPNERMTPLGELLVNLPLSPVLGKLIVLGIIFRCLDPLLILGAIGSDKDLFRRPMSDLQQIPYRQRRHAFGKGSASDQISTINAFKALRKEWFENGPSAAADFAYSNFLYFNCYREASIVARQILRRLSRMGVMDLSQLISDKENRQFGGLELNANSDNTLLIKTLLLHCLAPRIAVPKTYKNGEAFQYFTHSEGDKPKVYDFGASCGGNRSDSVAVYARKKRFSPSTMIMSEISLVSPLAACLFASTAKGSNGSVLVDDFLRVNVVIKDASCSEKEARSKLRNLHWLISMSLRVCYRLLMRPRPPSDDVDRGSLLLVDPHGSSDDEDRRLLLQGLGEELSDALVQTVTEVLGRDLHRIIPPERLPRWETVVVDGEIVG